MFQHLRPHHVFFGPPLVNGLLDVLVLRMRPDVNGRRIEPTEERLFALPVFVQPRHDSVCWSTSLSNVSIRLRAAVFRKRNWL
jgi:hypothetical protein